MMISHNFLIYSALIGGLYEENKGFCILLHFFFFNFFSASGNFFAGNKIQFFGVLVGKSGDLPKHLLLGFAVYILIDNRY